MPGYLLNMSAVVMCAHGGQAKFAAPNPRVKVGGSPVPMSSVPSLVAGCAFPPPPVANGPCVTATWIPPTATVRVKSMGQPLLVQSSLATCVPTGTPTIISFAGQVRVKGM
ncbi:MAG: hypothetical protein KA764_19280 [Anaerolineales bacterium]|nr:hypothetical protein [Anaerolineales bacterium]